LTAGSKRVEHTSFGNFRTVVNIIVANVQSLMGIGLAFPLPAVAVFN